MQWKVNNFFYGAIGNKLFKILSFSQEGIEILDSPNEDTIFLKANSWIKDVMQCLDDIIEKILYLGIFLFLLELFLIPNMVMII